jgi:2-amino-4-hydroxy-6-hydroxymethyldihydropteridine diphosphokinase
VRDAPATWRPGAPDAERDLAYVGLGSNVGDREAHLAAARRAMAALPGTRLVAATDVEETAPVGPVAQGAFLNQMVALETALAPLDLLDRLLDIERAEGRERSVRWGPRTLDLDIVLLERRTVADDRLTVPHPELPHRDWWQRELAALRAMPAVRAARDEVAA